MALGLDDDLAHGYGLRDQKLYVVRKAVRDGRPALPKVLLCD